MTKRQKKLLTRIIIAAVIYIAGIFLPLEGIPQLTLYLLCYAVIGWDIVWKAITNITHGQIFDENFLMTIATVGCSCSRRILRRCCGYAILSNW